MTSMQEHMAGVAAGQCSLESQPDDDFKFMTTSTVEEGEESACEEGELTSADLARLEVSMAARPESDEEPEAKDFGWIPPPPPNVATRITEVLPEVIDVGETDYAGLSKDRLIYHLKLAKDSFRIERGRSNAKTVLLDGKDLCISNLRRNKRQLQISEGNAVKELKRMRATVRKMTGQRTGLQDQLKLQLGRCRDFTKDAEEKDRKVSDLVRRLANASRMNNRLEERLGEKLESEESESDDPDYVDPNYR